MNLSEAITRMSEIQCNLSGENPKLPVTEIEQIRTMYCTLTIDKTKRLENMLFGFPLLRTSVFEYTLFVMCQSCHTVNGGYTYNLLGAPCCNKCGAPIE